MSNEWFVKTGDDIKGPFSQSALQEMARAGFVRKGDLVRDGDNGNWTEAGALQSLFPPSEDGGFEELTSLDDLNVDFGAADSGPQELTDLDDLNITLSSESESASEPEVAMSLDDLAMDVVGSESESAPPPRSRVPAASEKSQADTTDDPILEPEPELVEELPPLSAPDVVTPPSPETTPNETAKTKPPEKLWFCTIGGTEYGPVKASELATWAKEKRLTQSDYIRTTDSAEWVQATTMPELFRSSDPHPVQAAAPPPPVQMMPPAGYAQPYPMAPPPPDKTLKSQPSPPIEAEESKPAANEPVAPKPAAPKPVDQKPASVGSTGAADAAPSNTFGSLLQDMNTQALKAQMGMGSPSPMPGRMPPSSPSRHTSSSSSSGGGASFSLDPLKEFVAEKPMVVALLGLAIPILLWMYWPFGSSAGQAEYDTVMVAYQEFKEARDNGGDLDALENKTQTQFDPLIKNWEENAIGDAFALKAILFATRDGLLLMFEDSREKPGDAEKLFLEQMKEARSYLDGGEPIGDDDEDDDDEDEGDEGDEGGEREGEGEV